MKKLAILAFLCAAVSASAVSIKWSVGGLLYGVDGDGATQAFTQAGGWSDKFDNSAAFVLVYLGNDASGVTASAFTDPNQTAPTVVQTVSLFDAQGASDLVTTSGKAAAIGKANKESSLLVADTVGATYQVFFTMGGKYYDIYTDSSQAANTLASVTTKVAKDGAGAFSADKLWAVGGDGSSAAYVSVPEPSVAILGLLGIGMLIKRRRV